MTTSPADFKLEEPLFPTNAARLRRWLPWIRLLDGFRLAIDVRCMFLAVCAVILWATGDVILFRIFSEDGEAANDAIAAEPKWPWDRESLPASPATRSRVEFVRVLTAPHEFLSDMAANGPALLWPLRRLVDAGSLIFETDGSWSRSCLGCGSLLWGLWICAFFGGTICRLSALEFSGVGGGTLRDGIRFSGKRWPSAMGAPLTTLVGLALLSLPVWLVGLSAGIPGLGGVPVGMAWCVVLAAGTGMALLIAGVTAGFPLMVAGVATENGDAFDGLSRSFSYVFNRPWYALFLAVSAMLLGSALLYFVVGVLTLAVDLGVKGIEFPMGHVDAVDLFADAPVQEPFRTWETGRSEDRDRFSAWGRHAVGVWCRLWASIPAAFVFSYFWAGSTIIYFLLRLREDATPLEDMAVVPHSAPRSPLTGIPAARVREAAETFPTTSAVTPPEAQEKAP